jgi:hypothetical protein
MLLLIISINAACLWDENRRIRNTEIEKREGKSEEQILMQKKKRRQAAAGNNNQTRVVLIYGLILRDGHWAVTCLSPCIIF